MSLKFKVGDSVKMLEDSIDTNFSKGTVGKIERIFTSYEPSIPYRIETSDGNTRWVGDKHITLVEIESFEIGDKVEITSDTASKSLSKGTRVTIDSLVSMTGKYRVRTSGSAYRYIAPEDMKKLNNKFDVEAKPEIGDFMKVISDSTGSEFTLGNLVKITSKPTGLGVMAVDVDDDEAYIRYTDCEVSTETEFPVQIKFPNGTTVRVISDTCYHRTKIGTILTITGISEDDAFIDETCYDVKETRYFYKESNLELYVEEIMPEEIIAEASDDVTSMYPTDMVEHPSHYCTGGIEVIDYIKAKLSPEEFKGYIKGNALKYVSRSGKKWDEAEDLKKAKAYLGMLEEPDATVVMISDEQRFEIIDLIEDELYSSYDLPEEISPMADARELTFGEAEEVLGRLEAMYH